MIAGDLNVTAPGLNNPTGDPNLPEVLPGWGGVSNGLDHILGHPAQGEGDPAFPALDNFPAPGDHDIFVAPASW